MSDGLDNATVNWPLSAGSPATGSFAVIDTTAESSSLIVPIALSVVSPTNPPITLPIDNCIVSVVSSVESSVVATRTWIAVKVAGIVTCVPPTAGIQVSPPSVE